MASKVIKRSPKDSVDSTASPRPVALRTEGPRSDLASIAERIAGDRLCLRNWKFPRAEEYFPVFPLLRSVERYFPYAKGGALLVDEPVTVWELEQCKIKAQALHELGYRYLILERHMDEHDARMALEKVS